MRLAARGLVVAVLAVVPVLPVLAQETTATITGTVSDQTGAVLPGANVTARNVRTGLARETVSGDKGVYTISFLPVGRYEVSFAVSGFQTFVAREVDLHVNDRLRLDATLAAAGMTETVDVTAAAEMVQPTGQLQSLMGPVQVQELPINNRNFVLLATLVPGVTSDISDEVGFGLTSTTSISINGARRNAVNWLVDGASVVDVGSNITLLATPTLESIEEFKIITSSYNAEWPRSGGGIINVVTKSGTNEFRGSAYEFFRNDSLNANTYFRKQSTDAAIRDNPPELSYNNFGYTLGGPIKKDTLFFFWSQEWRRITRASSDVTANVVDPAWLTDPANPNFVPEGLRDPAAVALLRAWPAPNLGTNRFLSQQPNVNRTRQEVVRLDWNIDSSWRAMARYTQDRSRTEEAGGLFFNAQVPNVATTLTEVPGRVFVAQLTTTISPTTLNEFSYQFSGNDIETTNPDGTRNLRSDYNYSGAELFPGNAAGLMPIVRVTGLATIGANQLYNIEYRNHTIADNLTLQRGNHSFKLGGLVSFEAKNENAANITHGDYTFAAGGGFTAFQNFLRGNRGGACGSACSYTEAEVDVTNNLRFNRYEFYVQDTWRVRPDLTLDLGVRYSLFPAVKDKNDVLTSFSPGAWNPARAPLFTSAAGTALVQGSGDLLNGIIVAGRNSPHGRGIYATDKNNFGPRFGFAWDATGDGHTLVRGGAGIYFDQPLVGIFEQNAFVNPPFNSSVTVFNPALGSPGAGTPRGTDLVRNLIASSDPFETPRTTQWNINVARQLYSRGVLEVGYVGSRGDQLIRPVEINQALPADVLAAGAINPARPFRGYGTITMRETTGRSRYHGLLVNFRHDGGRAGLLQIAYTLSRNKADATNDRDAVDLPQSRLDLDAEYAVARTDRTHVFSANYIYELPFFRDSESGFLKNVLGGWQIAGITTIQSGPPVSRIVTGNTNGGRRGIRVNSIGDPFTGVPSDRHHINPAAFAPPADGQFGDSGRAPFRLPGRHQWDITLSKNIYPSDKSRLQLRVDFINAFDNTQFTTINNVCAAGPQHATCADVPGTTFGQYDGVRLPREIQLGLKFYWN